MYSLFLMVQSMVNKTIACVCACMRIFHHLSYGRCDCKMKPMRIPFSVNRTRNMARTRNKQPQLITGRMDYYNIQQCLFESFPIVHFTSIVPTTLPDLPRTRLECACRMWLFPRQHWVGVGTHPNTYALPPSHG